MKKLPIETKHAQAILRYKFLLPLAICYAMTLFVAQFFSYKIVLVGHFIMSAATFIVPFWYLLGDMITEIYGYSVSRKLIWLTILSALFFSILIDVLIHLPSPPSWHHQPEFNYVLGGLTKIAIADAIGCFVGGFINSYALSKWKILVQGRYYWMRSLGSTLIGQTVFIITALSIIFIGTMPFSDVLQIMTASLITKLAVAIVGVFPVSILVVIIKKKENMDVYDQGVDFNPFKY